jgi:NADH-quinone oxidoreductase subunit J
VLTGERLFDNSIRPLVEPVVSPALPAFGSPQAIGFALFTTYMLPFQMIAMLLLVAMIGALVLTHKESVAAPRRRDVRRVVSRPLTSVIASQIGSDVTKPTSEDAAEAAPSGD